jgi:tetratricopeptide (TPR) repeat protein
MSEQERANALVEQANALHNGGDKLQAAPLYVQAAGLFAPYASFALVAGDSFSEAGRDDEAIEAYRVCLAAHDDHDQAWAGLAQALHRSGRADEAREAFARAGLPVPGAAKPGLLKRWFGIG